MERLRSSDKIITKPEVMRQIERFKVDSNDPLAGALMSGLHSQYSIVGRVGAGGMGQIYLGFDNSGSKVAVKFISEEMIKKSDSDKKDIISRFYKEANAAAMIEHPNVIKVFDVGTYKDRIFLVMEFLEGNDLESFRRKQNIVPWDWLAPIMMDACEGLYAAHCNDPPIIHRDLSPDNIFLANVDGNRVVKVLDFGCAKFLEEEDDGLTKSGSALGKWIYMSPEQVEKAKGRRAEYDHRVDIYSLGVTMYRMLTGIPPFSAKESIQLLLMRLDTAPAMPREINPDISPEIEAIVMKAMARYEDDRYQDALALRADIEASLGGRLQIISSDLGSAIPPGQQGPGIKTSGQKMISEPISALRNLEQKSSGLGRFVKRVLVLGTLAGLGYGAYHYRDQIAEQWNQLSRQYVAKPNPPDSAPTTSSSAPQLGLFEANVSTHPEGAEVYLLVNGRIGRFLGSTPLKASLPNGNHTLLINKGGFRQKNISVSPANPSPPQITLSERARGSRRQRATAPANEPVIEDRVDEPETGEPSTEEPQ